MRTSDQFHVGVVVDDLDAALERLTALFGYRWCPPMDVPMPVSFADGDATVDLRFTYSASPPYLELIQTVPGTLWLPVEGSGLHHLGFWSDDVAADGAVLAEQGYGREAAGLQPDGSPYWSYHRSAAGPRIELVSRQVQSALEQYWASGRGGATA